MATPATMPELQETAVLASGENSAQHDVLFNSCGPLPYFP